MKALQFTLVISVMVLFTFFPLQALAGLGDGDSELIVCDDAPGSSNPCDYQDLVQLGINVINFLIYFSTAVVAIVFAFAGFTLLFSGGSTGQRDKAKEMFKKAAIGFMVVLADWLIVNTIVVALLDEDFVILR